MIVFYVLPAAMLPLLHASLHAPATAELDYTDCRLQAISAAFAQRLRPMARSFHKASLTAYSRQVRHKILTCSGVVVRLYQARAGDKIFANDIAREYLLTTYMAQ
jgi:hypothetical protein